MKKKIEMKEKRVRAYADVGSHGGIFYFAGGEIARRFPYLMHVYQKKVSNDLVPVTIIYKVPKK